MSKKQDTPKSPREKGKKPKRKDDDSEEDIVQTKTKRKEADEEDDSEEISPSKTKAQEKAKPRSKGKGEDKEEGEEKGKGESKGKPKDKTKEKVKGKNKANEPVLIPLKERDLDVSTLLVHADDDIESAPDLAPPIHMATTYKDSNEQGLVYSRAEMVTSMSYSKNLCTYF